LTVYLVMQSDWCDERVLSAFASESKAEAALRAAMEADKARIPCGYYVTSIEVDLTPEGKPH
jgi:hypothetical protein